ncbi:MAG: hypothetical protein M1834_001500 [Cirrosporium novae-zelandiae]|nr:MAG: hypothetical protein M1834_004017 [Cirrosporium novae-zelandiae]KAI9735486.1 MAG: hypothetical protein M1834_001500 [Cirrosporium novae-zelandiae]
MPPSPSTRRALLSTRTISALALFSVVGGYLGLKTRSMNMKREGLKNAEKQGELTGGFGVGPERSGESTGHIMQSRGTGVWKKFWS